MEHPSNFFLSRIGIRDKSVSVRLGTGCTDGKSLTETFLRCCLLVQTLKKKAPTP